MSAVLANASTALPLHQQDNAPAAANPTALLAHARTRQQDAAGAYAGAVTPPEAWTLFAADAARLVDVRTAAEVHYVGRVPNALHIEWHGKDPVNLERFLAALRERPEIQFARIPVILLTATASGELAERARALRANGYIVKPVTPDVLALRVERAMAR